MSGRTRLGEWRCRSGNHVEAFSDRDADGRGWIALEWDSPPPLSDGDSADYHILIRPAIIRRAQEFLELPGRALVVEL